MRVDRNILQRILFIAAFRQSGDPIHRSLRVAIVGKTIGDLAVDVRLHVAGEHLGELRGGGRVLIGESADGVLQHSVAFAACRQSLDIGQCSGGILLQPRRNDGIYGIAFVVSGQTVRPSERGLRVMLRPCGGDCLKRLRCVAVLSTSAALAAASSGSCWPKK